MTQYLILAQSNVTASSLEVWRKVLAWKEEAAQESCPQAIILNRQAYTAEGGTFGYTDTVERIKRLAKGEAATFPLNNVVVLVDSICPTEMSVVAETTSWHNLVAMLILTFPEIKWVFGAVVGELTLDVASDNKTPPDGHIFYKTCRFPLREHSLVSLTTAPRRDPIFDPTGLREWIRCCTNNKLTQLFKAQSQEESFFLARRNYRAAAIDEEIDYALMHAHAAYRYGFRADVVTSWALMEEIFQEGDWPGKRRHGYELLLEDMRLVFPDRPFNVHLSNLESERAVVCPLLANRHDKSLWRFLITTGQDSRNDDLIKANEKYLDIKNPGRGQLLFKPIGGITDLWQKGGLYDDLGNQHRRGNAKGYHWPPLIRQRERGWGEKFKRNLRHEFKSSSTAAVDDHLDGHGAPGKLALIAASLIRRAVELQKEAISSAEYLRCAMLAADAAEYLGGKTPTLSLTAITIKNDCEVRAECAFVGTGNSFALQRRFQEISQEVKAVTCWFHDGARAAAESKSTIFNRLVLAYREAGQVEEEHDCLVEFRRSNRKLNRPRGRNRFNPLSWVLHAALCYGEAVMASLGSILFVTLVWVSLISITSWLIDSGIAALTTISFNKQFDMETFIKVVSRTIGWMFGGNVEGCEEASSPSCLWLSALSSFGVLIGISHIGILISYLYSLIARK